MAYIGKTPDGVGVRSRFYFTQGSSGATSLSGNDDAGKTLTFSDGAYVDVLLNGVGLVAGTDYNTTTTNTIAGLAALASGDVVEVIVYDIFTVADTVSAGSGGTFAGAVTVPQLNADNLRLDGNTISSTDTNGNVNIDPAGTGDTIIASGSLSVGETSPLGTVHIRTSDASLTSVNGNADDLILENNGNCGMSICSSTSGEGNINFIDSGDTNIGRIQYTHSDNKMQFRTNDIVAATIDSSGNVGIGTSSPTRQLEVYDDGTNGQAVLALTAQNTENSRIMFADTDDNNIGILDYSHSDNSMRFNVNNAERMRIDSSGNVGINTTSGGAKLDVRRSDNEQVAFFLNENSQFNSNTFGISTSRNTTNGTYTHFQCSIHGVAVKLKVMDSGQVQNANGSYTSISDERMKENITDASSQWDDIKAVRLRNFNMIGDDLTQLGVVAQELEASGMTGLVGESNWYDVTANPDNEQRKYVKQSILYMKALGALQEAIAKIETLETKVAALEAGE